MIAARVGVAALALAACAAAAQVPAWSLEARQRLLAAPGSDRAVEMGERRALLDEGEARLAAGDVEAAQAAFDRAALLLHAPDTESALVRTYVQAGEYRRALAFGAHTAGAHRDFPPATALYAWLLHVGGHNAVAARKLAAALAQTPDDAALRTAREQLAQPWPVADGPLLAAPARLAPYATGVAAAAAVVASAMLVDGGRAAIAPADAIGAAAQVWLRNGLGGTTAATVSRRFEVAGVALALLHLNPPLAVPAAVAIAPRPPYAGSPGYTVEYAPSTAGRPAWPLLRTGFVGRAAAGEAPLLGLDVPPGPRGGPLFDMAGRIAGMAATGADRRDRWIPVSLLREAVGDVFGPVDDVASRVAADQIYESALKLALQVMVEPAPREYAH